MSKPKLFISHSTNGLPTTDRSVLIREHLYSVLSNGWDVFLDRERIHPGDKWRTEILRNLMQAQAGIILFNEKATQSDWVTAEALILCFYTSINPQFKLIPLLLDGKKIDDTCFKRYEPFQLNGIQNITDDCTLEPKVFVNKILQDLDPVKVGSSPMNQWVTQVTGILKNVDIDTLGRAAEQLGLNPEEKLSALHEKQRKDILSRSLAELMHYKAPLKSVEPFNILTISLDLSLAKSLKNFIRYKWVENEAVEILLLASRESNNKDFFTVNTKKLTEPKKPTEIEIYLKRAMMEIQGLGKSVYRVMVGAPSGDDDEVILYNIEQDIRASLPQEFNVFLKSNVIVIGVLPHEYGKERILKKLHNRYPKIIFLVQVKTNQLTQFNAIGGKPLNPPLDENKHHEFDLLNSHLSQAIKTKEFCEED